MYDDVHAVSLHPLGMESGPGGRGRWVWGSLRLAGGLLLASMTTGCGDDTTSPPADEPPPPKGEVILSGDDFEVEVLRDIQLTEQARIPETDAFLTSVDDIEVEADSVTFHYTQAPAIALEPGHVIAGAAEHGYLRWVRGVSEPEENVIVVETEPATITDLILDGHFKVHTLPHATSWEEGAVVPYLASGAEAKLQLFTPELFPALKCSIGGGGSVTLEPQLDITPDLDFELDVTVDLLPISGKLNYALVAASLDVETGVAIETQSTLGGSCALDLVSLMEKYAGIELARELPTIQFALPTPLGPLPVIITEELGPTGSIELGISTTTDKSVTTASVHLGARVGAEYAGGEWNGIWEPTVEGGIDYDEPVAVGTTTVSAQAAMGMEIKGFLYDTAGPKAGAELFLKGQVAADAELCSWDATLTDGLNAVVGVEAQVPVFDITLASYTQTFTLAEVELAAVSGSCLECETDDDCTDAARPVCDVPNNTCVECLTTTDCDDDDACSNETCTAMVCERSYAPGPGCDAVWTQMSPATSPPMLGWSAGAYDPISDRVITFGGTDGNAISDETWAWDGSDWTQLNPATSPPARYVHGMAYDPVLGKVVLFGGCDALYATSCLNDTWEWNGANWVQASPTTSPPGRSVHHNMAFNPSTGHVMIFGGGSGSGPSQPTLADAWEYDGATWTPVGAGPSARAAACMASDTAQSRVLMYGGGTWTDPYESDTWSFANSSASQLAGGPPPMMSANCAFDAWRERFVIHAAAATQVPFAVLGDTWEFDGTSWSDQTQATGGPTSGCCAVMTQNPGGRGVMLLMDGTWVLEPPVVQP